MAPRALEAAKVEGDPQTYEDQNVHAIYDEIAAHFSSTRYKVRFYRYLRRKKFSTSGKIALAYNRQILIQSYYGICRT